MITTRPTYVDIDLAAIAANVEVLKSATDADWMCAVVKANAYGHGAVPVAKAVLEAGATHLAVALVEEARELRGAGIDAPILLLTEPPVPAAKQLFELDITPVVYTREFLDALSATAVRRNATIEVHVHFDTGMGRVGVPEEDWDILLRDVKQHERITVVGLMTHLARADEPNEPASRVQIHNFDRALTLASDLEIDPPLVHAANSAAALLRADSSFSMIRPGIALYGLSPAPDVPAADHDLTQALTLSTQVSFVKEVKKGMPASYGHIWEAPDDGFLATLPIGYADGVPRALTAPGRPDEDNAHVLIRGGRFPIVGRVTMDQILVWCDQTEVLRGEDVVLLGTQSGHLGTETVSVDEWAAAAGTISYEIACGLSSRLPRRYGDGDGWDGAGQAVVSTTAAVDGWTSNDVKANDGWSTA